MESIYNMNESIRISVCVSVYKTERYLQQCIDSLMNQTIDGVEYIFINDASPDKCAEILRQNKQIYFERIRIISHEKNLGLGEARNTALKNARGEYIGFVDSDDFVAPWMFETLYQNAVMSGADVTYIQYARVSENEVYNKDEIEAEGANIYKPIFSWDQRILRLNNKKLLEENITDLLVYPIGGLYCALWKKSFLINCGIVFPAYRYEDNYFVSLIRCYLKKITFVPKVCYFYRTNPNSTVHARNAPWQLERIQIEKLLLTEVKKRGLFEKHFAGWEYTFILRFAYNTSLLLLNTFDNPPIKVINQIWQNLENEFPNWQQNPYYCQQFGIMKRFKCYLLSRFPQCLFYLLRFIKYVKLDVNKFRIKSVLF